jgi:hypothetical protein
VAVSPARAVDGYLKPLCAIAQSFATDPGGRDVRWTGTGTPLRQDGRARALTKGAVVGDRGHELDRDLLQELLSAYGPCGQEDAVRDLCRRELGPLVDATWVDPAGNLVA